MDRSRFRRPGIQKQSQQTTKNTFGISKPVSKANSLYDQNYDTKLVSNKETHGFDSKITQTKLAGKSEVSKTRPRYPIIALLARKQPIDMSLPGAESSQHIKELTRRAKWRSRRLNATRSVAVLLVIMMTLGGLIFSQSYLKLHSVFRGGAATAAALNPKVSPYLLSGENNGRVNILILGRGGSSQDNPDMTNTIMLASIDTVNNQATIVSLPSNLWVNVPGAGVMQLKSAWQSGEFKYLGKNTPGSTSSNAINAGFDLVDQTVDQVLGLNINYNVIVNYQAIQQAVNTVGGINVNVPSALVDNTMAWENQDNPTLAQAGLQTFNGSQTLNYIRSVETTNDSSREQRQRDVLTSLENKIVTVNTLANPLKVSELISEFGNNVATDISMKDAYSLFSILKNINPSSVASIGLNNTTNQYVTSGNISGQSITLPTSGLFQYKAIQSYMITQLKNPYIIKEAAKVLVLNGTDVPGMATNLANQLKTYGYNVIGQANTPTNNWAHTTLYDLSGGQDGYTEHYLEQALNLKAKTSLANKNIPTNDANFVIIIGTNEANISQNQTN